MDARFYPWSNRNVLTHQHLHHSHRPWQIELMVYPTACGSVLPNTCGTCCPSCCSITPRTAATGCSSRAFDAKRSVFTSPGSAPRWSFPKNNRAQPETWRADTSYRGRARFFLSSGGPMKRLYLLFALLLFAAPIIAHVPVWMPCGRHGSFVSVQPAPCAGALHCPSGESPHGSRWIACACGKAPDR